MRYETIQAKTLLSKPIYGDSWFHSNRSMNAYRGCEHGCVYCDGHCQYYRIDNFYNHIRIKENAPKILRRELERMKYRSQSKLQSSSLVRFLDKDDASRVIDQSPRKIIIGISGGVSDAYQPAEEQYKITRQVLETVLDFRMPVFVLTKSDLVLRDLDLLKEIHQHAFANVCFSITLHDEETKTIFEPKSSATWERFEALKQIRKAGLFGGVQAVPTIPGIGDTVENMQELAKDAKKANAEYILFAGMTLKPGRQKEYFFNVVHHQMPEAYDLLQDIYANNHAYGHPILDRLPVNVMVQGYKICQQVGISDRSIRHMMPNEPEANVQVLNALLDLTFYRSITLGKPKRSWQPYHELAIQIEKGVLNLAELQKQGLLEKQLAISPKMTHVIEEILQTGTCQALTDIRKELDQLAEKISI
ncbi:MAG: radical SAM protein [Candidatus Hermodarchaeota archaeon]